VNFGEGQMKNPILLDHLTWNDPLMLTPKPNTNHLPILRANHNENANQSLNLTPKGKVWKVMNKVLKNKRKLPR